MTEETMRVLAEAAAVKRMVVVELTDGRAYLGILKATPSGAWKVMTGFRGHPAIVWADEVDAVTLAYVHPDVVVG